jgi:hypothetical protein
LGWVKTPITYVALTREEEHGSTNAEWRMFGIYYNDERGVEKTDNRPASVRALDFSAINIGTYGGHFIMANTSNVGTFDLLGWAACPGRKLGEANPARRRRIVRGRLSAPYRQERATLVS